MPTFAEVFPDPFIRPSYSGRCMNRNCTTNGRTSTYCTLCSYGTSPMQFCPDCHNKHIGQQIHRAMALQLRLAGADVLPGGPYNTLVPPGTAPNAADYIDNVVTL